MPDNQLPGKSSLSNPAKILLAYMRCSGITDAKTLAADLDIAIRTIQRLKLECAGAMDGVSSDNGSCANDAISGAIEPANDATCAINGVSDAPNTPDMALVPIIEPSRAHATKESPSEIVIYSEVDTTPLVPHPDDVLPPAVLASAENKTRGTRLSDDWDLPVEWRQWAEINTQLGNFGIQLEADKFRDFWIAQPGAKGRKSNWQATWRNWCRNAGSRRPYNPQRMAHDERTARLEAEGKPTSVSEALALRIRQRQMQEAANAAA